MNLDFEPRLAVNVERSRCAPLTSNPSPVEGHPEIRMLLSWNGMRLLLLSLVRVRCLDCCATLRARPQKF